jgi:dephospho-CoA kinase
MLRDDEVLAVEAIKLLESSMRSVYDQIWVVVAPRDAMLERLEARGLPRAEAEARLRHQRSEAAFREAADVVIENAGDREATRAQVRRAWDALRPTA